MACPTTVLPAEGPDGQTATLPRGDNGRGDSKTIATVQSSDSDPAEIPAAPIVGTAEQTQQGQPVNTAIITTLPTDRPGRLLGSINLRALGSNLANIWKRRKRTAFSAQADEDKAVHMRTMVPAQAEEADRSPGSIALPDPGGPSADPSKDPQTPLDPEAQRPEPGTQAGKTTIVYQTDASFQPSGRSAKPPPGAESISLSGRGKTAFRAEDYPPESSAQGWSKGDGSPEPLGKLDKADTNRPSTRSPSPDLPLPSPPAAGKKSRNLVVVLDGTANQFGKRNSNCVELYSHLEKSDLQKTYYNSGIGTYINPETHGRLSSAREKLLNAWDMAVAFRLKRYIIGAYRWLSTQYVEGDKIFLFGFSRGAYEVRALAAMLHKVGLIHTGNEEQIEFAYDLYADSSEDGQTLAEVFKKTFARDIGKVHFIGVWDTVSSVGLATKKTLPDVSDTENVYQIRHAVALDERRVKFQPELYYSPGGKDIEHAMPHVKEVWFPGSHSDVGGGNKENSRLILGDVPLVWMEWQAMQ